MLRPWVPESPDPVTATRCDEDGVEFEAGPGDTLINKP